MHPKRFHWNSKLNSYVMSISRRGPLNLSNPTFLNINLTQRVTCLIVCLENKSKLAAIISICILILLIWVQNHFLIWCKFFVVARQILQLQRFPLSILQKRWQIYLLFGKSLKKGYNDHNFPFFKLEYELQIIFLSNITFSSCLNSSSPTFDNINLTETVISCLVVDWKFY